MKFYVYILWSTILSKYYIGSTSDIYKRLEEHNSGKCKFTRKGKPWELVFYEEFATRAEAVKRERQIKKRKSKQYIEGLIKKR